MGSFLRENWIWIVSPIVIVLLGLCWMIWMGGSGDGDTPFLYNIY
ncbi:MAG TPA: hypothetical protein QF764_15875 [Planctomycetota bacterium]|jgi:hypothetical protein|nr:hypothetical protein [Planctomycetota bacterium]